MCDSANKKRRDERRMSRILTFCTFTVTWMVFAADSAVGLRFNDPHYSASFPSAYESAFKEALTRWGSVLDGPNALDVFVGYRSFSKTKPVRVGRAQGGPTTSVCRDQLTNTEYIFVVPSGLIQEKDDILRVPGPLAAQFLPKSSKGIVTNFPTFPGGCTERVHMEVEFNSDYEWYGGTDDKVPETEKADDAPGTKKEYLLAEAFHEIGHGLGFLGRLRSEDGQYIDGEPNVYDMLVMYGSSGEPNEQNRQPSGQLFAASHRSPYLFLDDLCWGGEHGRRVYAGEQEHFGGIWYPGGYPAIYSRPPDGNNAGAAYDHFDTALGYSTKAVMAIKGPSGALWVNLMAAVQVLRDIGWPVITPFGTTIICSGNRYYSISGRENSLLARSLVANAITAQPLMDVLITNNMEENLSITALSWTLQSNQFSVMNEDEVLGSALLPCKSRLVSIAFTPSNDSEPGYKCDYLRISYNTASGTKQKFVKVDGFIVGNDEDKDGIPDDYECDPSVEDCTSSPFIKGEDDSSGDKGAIGSDGKTDGNNDYDGDGFCNAEEIARGSDPLDRASTPSTPLNDGVSKVVTFRNPSIFPVDVTSVEIIGADADSFFISDGGERRSIEAHEETTVSVLFVPTSGGDKTDAALRVHYDSCGDSKTEDIALHYTEPSP